jgi:hypothetical protein
MEVSLSSDELVALAELDQDHPDEKVYDRFVYGEVDDRLSIIKSFLFDRIVVYRLQDDPDPENWQVANRNRVKVKKEDVTYQVPTITNSLIGHRRSGRKPKGTPDETYLETEADSKGFN